MNLIVSSTGLPVCSKANSGKAHTTTETAAAALSRRRPHWSDFIANTSVATPIAVAAMSRLISTVVRGMPSVVVAIERQNVVTV